MPKKSHNLRLVGFIGLILSYSLLAHYTLQSKAYASVGVIIALAPIALTCFILAFNAKRRGLMFSLIILLSPLLWLASHYFKQHYEWVYWLVHESLQFLLLLMFARTLSSGKQPLCSQFAQMVHSTLSPELAQYTRKLTIAWVLIADQTQSVVVLFFGIVIIVSSYLFFFYPIRVWSIFSNFVYLPLVGLMFIIEYIVRFWALPKKDRSNIMHAIHAFIDKNNH